MRQRHMAATLENKVGTVTQLGLFSLVVFSVLREGVETVLFLGASGFVSGISTLGATLGIIAAVLLGIILSRGAMKINLRAFFTVTSIILLVFAGTMITHGIEELEEAHVLPTGAAFWENTDEAMYEHEELAINNPQT